MSAAAPALSYVGAITRYGYLWRHEALIESSRPVRRKLGLDTRNRSWLVTDEINPFKELHMIRPAIALGLFALSASTVSAETFSADVWADNWFELRIDAEQVAEDSVPITTERSFNAESFTFEAEPPFVIGLVARDFKENDTGLEYIGTRRQQMGDGGVILQLMDSSGATVAVSDASWRCLVVHTAPLDKSCESEANPVAGQGACTFEVLDEPEGWDRPGFDDSDWAAATVYSEREVSPKDGYDRVDWVDSAELVWGPDLEQSNTVLCRLAVE